MSARQQHTPALQERNKREFSTARDSRYLLQFWSADGTHTLTHMRTHSSLDVLKLLIRAVFGLINEMWRRLMRLAPVNSHIKPGRGGASLCANHGARRHNWPAASLLSFSLLFKFFYFPLNPQPKRLINQRNTLCCLFFLSVSVEAEMERIFS